MISHFPDKRNYIAPLAGLKVLLLLQCLLRIRNMFQQIIQAL